MKVKFYGGSRNGQEEDHRGGERLIWPTWRTLESGQRVMVRETYVLDRDGCTRGATGELEVLAFALESSEDMAEDMRRAERRIRQLTFERLFESEIEHAHASMDAKEAELDEHGYGGRSVDSERIIGLAEIVPLAVPVSCWDCHYFKLHGLCCPKHASADEKKATEQRIAKHLTEMAAWLDKASR